MKIDFTNRGLLGALAASTLAITTACSGQTELSPKRQAEWDRMQRSIERTAITDEQAIQDVLGSEFVSEGMTGRVYAIAHYSKPNGKTQMRSLDFHRTYAGLKTQTLVQIAVGEAIAFTPGSQYKLDKVRVSVKTPTGEEFEIHANGYNEVIQFNQVTHNRGVTIKLQNTGNTGPS